MRVTLSNQTNSIQQYEFKKILTIVLVYLGADMLSYAFDMQTFVGARIGNHISMFLSISITTFIGFWCNKFFDILFPTVKKGVRRDLIYLLPTVIVTVLLIINLFTGWIYIIGTDNIYTRSFLYPVSFVLQYISFAAVLLRAIFFKFDVITIRRRQIKSNIIWFSSMTLLFGVLQAVMGGKISLHCFGITAGLLIIYLGFQERQITNDILTGLHNRQALDKYVADKTKAYASGANGQKSLYFIIMDINDFKSINDLYGHVEGDQALKDVSDVLKDIGRKHRLDLFLCRYGGDEFAAVFETDAEENVSMLCEDIKNSLTESSKNGRYKLSTAVGYSKYTGKDMTIDDLYGSADKVLYEDKSRMKQHITY